MRHVAVHHDMISYNSFSHYCRASYMNALAVDVDSMIAENQLRRPCKFDVLLFLTRTDVSEWWASWVINSGSNNLRIKFSRLIIKLPNLQSELKIENLIDYDSEHTNQKIIYGGFWTHSWEVLAWWNLALRK